MTIPTSTSTRTQVSRTRIGRSRLRASALTATAVLTGSLLMASPASAAVRGLNLQQSGCDAQAPGTNLVLRQNNAYGWRCFTGIYDLSIDINRACRWTYGSGSSAYYLNYNDPYSWRCR